MAASNDAHHHDPADDWVAAPLVIHCDTRSASRWSWLFSGLIAGPAFYGAYSMTRGTVDWSRDWPILSCFVIVFPAIAGFVVLASIWATLLARKQGVTTLRIPRGTVVEGDLLRGTLECARPLELRGPAKATLECLELRNETRDNEAVTIKRQAWSAEVTLRPEAKTVTARNRSALSGGTHFPLEIRVPEMRRSGQAAPTERGVVSASARLRWTLTLNAPLRGLDHEAHFDVPILSKADAAAD